MHINWKKFIFITRNCKREKQIVKCWNSCWIQPSEWQFTQIPNTRIESNYQRQSDKISNWRNRIDAGISHHFEAMESIVRGLLTALQVVDQFLLIITLVFLFNFFFLFHLLSKRKKATRKSPWYFEEEFLNQYSQIHQINTQTHLHQDTQHTTSDYWTRLIS